MIGHDTGRRFRLQAWGDPAGVDEVSDDGAAMRARALALAGCGDFRRVDISAWSLELNDWIRLERFPPGSGRGDLPAEGGPVGVVLKLTPKG